MSKGQRPKRHQSTRTTKNVQEMYSTAEINSSISNKKSTRHLTNIGKKNLWISKESANLTESHPNILSVIQSQPKKNETEARDKFIKGPLKLQLVLETIESDKYNRKYGDKKAKSRKHRKTSSDSSPDGEQIA